MKHNVLNATLNFSINLQNGSQKASQKNKKKKKKIPNEGIGWSRTTILRESILEVQTVSGEIHLQVLHFGTQELLVLDLNIERENNCFYSTILQHLLHTNEKIS